MDSWPYPRLVAHRGGGTLAPENTLEAFDAGLRYGYRAAELDAVLAADDVPVLMHDPGLERTTDGSGCVAARTAAELARLDAGSWFGPQFAHARVPTLWQTLRHCRERGIWLNIEIKPVAGADERTGRIVARIVADFCDGAGGAGWAAPLLSSFSAAALVAARAAAPELRRGLLVGPIAPDTGERARGLGCYSVHCDHRSLDAEQVRRIKDLGYGVLCYTVNDPGRARELLAWGVDAICTDRIDRLDPAEYG
jgi:glycerophosphoryl diester phosphodiesterase